MNRKYQGMYHSSVTNFFVALFHTVLTVHGICMYIVSAHAYAYISTV